MFSSERGLGGLTGGGEVVEICVLVQDLVAGRILFGFVMKIFILGGWGVEVKEVERGSCRRFIVFSVCEEVSRMREF